MHSPCFLLFLVLWMDRCFFQLETVSSAEKGVDWKLNMEYYAPILWQASNPKCDSSFVIFLLQWMCTMCDLKYFCHNLFYTNHYSYSYEWKLKSMFCCSTCCCYSKNTSSFFPNPFVFILTAADNEQPWTSATPSVRPSHPPSTAPVTAKIYAPTPTKSESNCLNDPLQEQVRTTVEMLAGMNNWLDKTAEVDTNERLALSWDRRASASMKAIGTCTDGRSTPSWIRTCKNVFFIYWISKML